MKFRCDGCREDRGSYEEGEYPEGIRLNRGLIPNEVHCICARCLKILRAALRKKA